MLQTLQLASRCHAHSEAQIYDIRCESTLILTIPKVETLKSMADDSASVRAIVWQRRLIVGPGQGGYWLRLTRMVSLMFGFLLSLPSLWYFSVPVAGLLALPSCCASVDRLDATGGRTH